MSGRVDVNAALPNSSVPRPASCGGEIEQEKKVVDLAANLFAY